MEQMNIEELAAVLDEVGEITVCGRLIGATRNAEPDAVDDSYPLRFHLHELSRQIWADLMKWQRRLEDIMHAVDVVSVEFKSFFPAAEAAETDEESNDEEVNELCLNSRNSEILLDDDLRTCQEIACLRSCSDENLLDDDAKACQEIDQLTTEDRTAHLSSPLLKWYLQTDASVGLESVAGEWLERKELWQIEAAWTWADVHDFLALLTIDSAVLHIEQHEPFKAAVAAARASDHHGMAIAIRWSGSVQEATASTLGRRGADARHGPNRAAREEAIRLYLSKSWPSLAQAARSIAAEVHRTERVVEKWLREHRRGLSAGTVPT
jgi:hypothetical protein